MRIHELSESTVAGSIATVASPLGATQTRSQKPPKAPKVVKGRKYANVISEGKMKELAYDLEHLDPGNFKKKYGKTKEEVKASLSKTKVKEAEVLIVPGMRRMKDKSFISHKEDRRDHEVEMARSDLYAAAKNAMRIFQILKSRSEDDGLMGWQQSYITLATDYLNSVTDSLEYDAKVRQSLDEMNEDMTVQKNNYENIKSTEDALNVLGYLRHISKGVEKGIPYDGNLANKYVNDVWYVYTWLEPRVNVYDPKLKNILDEVFWLRAEAKKLERQPGSSQNKGLANQIVNTLWLLMQWIEMNVEDDKQGVTEGKRIARKPGQPANSKKHSDLYTDENPKGYIQ